MNEKLDIQIEDMIKLKVIDIDGYNYKLETTNGYIKTINIDIYDEIKIEINDYIYMSTTTLKENIPLQFGPIHNNKNEIIKVVNENKERYFQRYYGWYL